MRRSRTLPAKLAPIALLALALPLFAAAALLGSLSAPENTARAQSPAAIHGPYSATDDSCASCHRSHDNPGKDLITAGPSESSLCLSCHDGTGAATNVAAQYSDASVPANNATTSSFYSHPATTPSNHTNGQDDEFAGVLNRHSDCGDCHNPHAITTAFATQTASGWTASGTLAGTTGVSGSTPLTWKSPASYEYETCLKCHSSYTQLPSYTKESYKETDKAAEFNPAGASFHPVEGAGTNQTTAMQNSLSGGRLWQFKTTDTIRCAQCHGNYRLVANPPVSNSPPSDALLSSHTSANRGILIANYRDRDLKSLSATNDYASNDFSLCLLCHSEAPFTDVSGNARSDSNFRFHGYHLSNIFDNPGNGLASTDIDAAGAGQGNAICAECHYRQHGTETAYWASQQSNSRLLNFAPNVQPLSGQAEPLWDPVNKTCTLTCHGQAHDHVPY